MTVKEAILSVDKDVLFNELSNCFEKPDSVKYETFNQLLQEIENIEPDKTYDNLLMTSYEEDGCIIYDTFMFDTDWNDWSLFLMDWNHILGLQVDDSNFKLFSLPVIAAHVLYEMSWFGYREEDMIKYRDSLSESANDLDGKTYKNAEEMWSDICEEQ